MEPERLDREVEPFPLPPFPLAKEFFGHADVLEAACESTSDKPFSNALTKFSKYERVTLLKLEI